MKQTLTRHIVIEDEPTRTSVTWCVETDYLVITLKIWKYWDMSSFYHRPWLPVEMVGVVIVDLGYHYKSNKRSDYATHFDKCSYMLDKSPCWYDGTTTGAEEIWRRVHSEEDIWNELSKIAISCTEELATR